MSSNLMQYEYLGQGVRILEENGEALFVASDVARVLCHRDATAMVRALDEDERGTRPTCTPGGTQDVTVLTESGFYHAVLLRQTGRMSDPGTKEAVKAFQRWVTHEVLPQIRKTGEYTSQPQVPQSLPEALRAYAREVEAREAMEAYAKELEPKGEAYDAFLSGDGTYSIGNVAKMHGLSQNRLFALMRSAGVMIAKGAMRNTPYQRYMHHFAVKAYDFTRTDGTVGTSYTTRVQPSGVDFLRRKLSLTPATDVEVAA
ncbi:phage antirepressor [Kocuria rhizophila]|uniref:phage antirepressor n=1 Tax=Kocuria rhizophila TaxID=72000 RepID=UPI003D6EA8B9